MNNGKVQYRNVPIRNPLAFERNRWLLFYNGRSRNDAQKMIQDFKTCCRGIGIKVDDPREIQHNCRYEEDFVNELNRIENIRSYSIIVIILSRGEKTLYKEIKKQITSNFGIPSQVVIRENFQKGLSYFTNVILQMNYKIGGELFVIGNITSNVRNRV